tara:strand:- start:1361 stop:1918 length:558 start_codon:yes stop_codon:yes gene_type:complete
MNSMKHTLFFLLLSTCAAVSAQQHITRAGHVHFFSSTPLEDIEADTHQMSAILDLSNEQAVGFAFQVPILSFHFEKALMEEHFNESYLESEQFPRATFEGIIENWGALSDNGDWSDVVASGMLTIHGIQRERMIQGQMRMNGDSWEIQAAFDVLTADHDIKIPKMVQKQIADRIAVTVEAQLTPR